MGEHYRSDWNRLAAAAVAARTRVTFCNGIQSEMTRRRCSLMMMMSDARPGPAKGCAHKGKVNALLNIEQRLTDGVGIVRFRFVGAQAVYGALQKVNRASNKARWRRPRLRRCDKLRRALDDTTHETRMAVLTENVLRERVQRAIVLYDENHQCRFFGTVSPLHVVIVWILRWTMVGCDFFMKKRIAAAARNSTQQHATRKC